MDKFKFLFILFLIIILPLIFLSTEKPNFFYEIVKDFYILTDSINFNHFVLYYRYYELAKQRYFIYGYDSKNDKFYGFSPENEFITTGPFLNESSTAFAYGALYQGNDFVWFKDFKNKLAYKILYSISGKLSLLSLDRSNKNIIVGFDYLSPSKFLYISGVKEFYTYPLTSYPNIIKTGFTYDEKYVYVVFLYEGRYNCDILTLSSDPYHSSSYKPVVKKVFSNADELIYIGDFFFVTREKNQYFLYDLKDYNVTRINDINILKDNNDEINSLILLDGVLYNKKFQKITLGNNIDEKILFSLIKLNKNIFYSDRFLMIKDEKKILYILELDVENNVLKPVVSINQDAKNLELVQTEKIKVINQFEGNFFIIVENPLLLSNSFSILIYNPKLNIIETVYSDNIFSFVKALNCKTGFAFLVKKEYTKGIFQELYYFSFITKNVLKISGYENVTENDLNLLKRDLQTK